MSWEKRTIDLNALKPREPSLQERHVAYRVVSRPGRKTYPSALELMAHMAVAENTIHISAPNIEAGTERERGMYVETEEHLFIEYAEKVFFPTESKGVKMRAWISINKRAGRQ